MSTQIFGEDVLFLQRLLKSCGYYTGKLDSDWGPLTDSAVHQFETVSRHAAAQHGWFDGRSEACIATLHPRAQEMARAFLSRVRGAGIDARIISGTRTYAEQDTLYRQGRWGNPGPIVTKARGGQSNHNFGIAWDIGVFEGGRYLPRSPLYDEAAGAGIAPGIEWGGNWVSFPDKPHYQLATSLKLAALRDRFESGLDYV